MPKADSIRIFSCAAPHMRTFHLTWLAFFAAFVSWFSLAPLTFVWQQDLRLSDAQVVDTVTASVVSTILARLVIGHISDRIGPRRAMLLTLVLGSVPLAFTGLVNSFGGMIVCRLLIGIIGASFVCCQQHTTIMFSPRVVGLANATAGGWGNLGGGIAQILIPALFVGLRHAGLTDSQAWRVTLLLPFVFTILVALLHFRFSFDSPSPPPSKTAEQEDQTVAAEPSPTATSRSPFLTAALNPSVWCLFLLYGASFGVELTLFNLLHDYLHRKFSINVLFAGLIAALFGFLNIFSRSLGGWTSDRANVAFGFAGRLWFLFFFILLEGIFFVLFSTTLSLTAAIVWLTLAAIALQCANGAVFGVVPVVARGAMGSASGIVGAGGNVGAVLSSLIFRAVGTSRVEDFSRGYFIVGLCVIGCATASLAVRHGGQTAWAFLQRSKAMLPKGEEAEMTIQV